MVALDECDHRVCTACTLAAVKAWQPTTQRDYRCPVPGCKQVLAQGAAKRLLSAEDFEKFLDLALADLSLTSPQLDDAPGGGGALVKCPKGCGWAVLVDAQSPAGTPSNRQCPQWESSVGIDGQKISEEAAKHRQTYRFR